MFAQKVVFVVGAGASREYNFPVGSALKERIGIAIGFRHQHGELLSGSDELLGCIRRHIKNDPEALNRYLSAARLLSAAIPSYASIDEALHFVSGTPEAVEIGKIAIVQEILTAERNSTLAFDPQNGRLKQLPGGWIGELFSMVIAGARREELRGAFENVSFVNFNYDRAIEQGLYWLLQERTSASSGEAKEIVDGLKMIRPYGSIGQFVPNMHDELAFGTTTYFDPFSRLANLGTYTEQKPLHDLAAMGNALREAKLIIVLGFGYHPSNLDLIKLAEGNGSAVVLGTVSGIHNSNHRVIARRIAANLRMAEDSIDLHDMKAEELLCKLRPRISMLAG